MNINCPICGTDIPEGSTNCPGCGLDIQDLLISPEEKTKLKEKKQKEAEEKERQLEAAKAAQEATAAEQEAEAKRIAQVKAEQEAEKERLEAERAALREEARRLEAAKKDAAAHVYADSDPKTNAAAQEEAGNSSSSQNKPAGRSKSGNKGSGVIAAVCTVAVLGVGAAGYTLFLKKPASVNMNPYLSLEFSGVDGEGYAECHFNLSQLIKDNEKVFALNDKGRAKIKSLVHMDPSEKASDSELITALFADLYDNGPVSLVIEPDTDLKNGEKVSVSWIGGEETLEDLFGVNFICDRSTFTVKGLEEGSSEESADHNNNSDSQGNTVNSDKLDQNTTEASEVLAGEEAETEEASAQVETEKQEQTEKPTTTQKPAKTPTTTPKPEQKPKDYGKYRLVNTDYLTLRSSATLNNQNNKIMQIPGNAEVTVLQFECNGYWKVRYDGKEGYVLPSYLSPCDGAKEPEKIASYKVITDYVTMRDIPSTEGESFGKITTGEVVKCFDTADNGFLLILYQGRYGYILKNYNGEVLLEKV